jgi:hypothetical protein
MGLLDDAIREHLELKRVRGADPSEVIREEREALGVSARQDMVAPGLEGDDETRPDQDSAVSPGAERADPGSIEPLLEEDGEQAPPPTEPGASDSAADDTGGDRARREPARMALDQETAEVDMEAMLGLEDERRAAAAADEADAREADADDDEPWGDDAWRRQQHGGYASEHTHTGEEPGEPLEPA